MAHICATRPPWVNESLAVHRDQLHVTIAQYHYQVRWWKKYAIQILLALVITQSNISQHDKVTICHHNDVIMSAKASQITSLTIVCSTVYSGTDERKQQSSASLAFVSGIHRWPVNSAHKGPVMRTIFPFDDFIMWLENIWILYLIILIILHTECAILTNFLSLRKKLSKISYQWPHFHFRVVAQLTRVALVLIRFCVRTGFGIKRNCWKFFFSNHVFASFLPTFYLRYE